MERSMERSGDNNKREVEMVKNGTFFQLLSYFFPCKYGKKLEGFYTYIIVYYYYLYYSYDFFPSYPLAQNVCVYRWKEVILVIPIPKWQLIITSQLFRFFRACRHQYRHLKSQHQSSILPRKKILPLSKKLNTLIPRQI